MLKGSIFFHMESGFACGRVPACGCRLLCLRVVQCMDAINLIKNITLGKSSFLLKNKGFKGGRSGVWMLSIVFSIEQPMF